MLYKEQVTQGICNALDTTKVSTTVKSFDQYSIITRAANTTAYAAGQLISGISAVNSVGTISNYNGTTLIPIDLTPDGASANQRIEIIQLSILSDQNPNTSVLTPIVQIFNSSLSGLSDTQAFTPNFSTLNNYRQVLLQSELSNIVNSGTNAYYITSADYTRLANLDSHGKLYIALIAGNAYTPKSGEQIKIRIRGFIL